MNTFLVSSFKMLPWYEHLCNPEELRLCNELRDFKSLIKKKRNERTNSNETLWSTFEF